MNAVLQSEHPIKSERWGLWMTLLWLVVWLMATQIFLALALISGYMYAYDLPLAQATFNSISNQIDLMLWVSVWAHILSLPLLYWMVKSKANSSWIDYLSLKPVSIGWVISWVLICFAAVMLIGVLHETMKWPRSDFMAKMGKPQSVSLLIIAVVIFAPIIEEWIFRGFCFVGFERVLGGLPTILITTLLFTAIHIQYNVYELLQIFVLGFILGLARWHTQSLITPIVIHGVNNLWAVVVALFFLPQ